MVWRCPTHDVLSIDDLCPHCQRIVEERKRVIKEITAYLKTSKYATKEDKDLLRMARKALQKLI